MSFTLSKVHDSFFIIHSFLYFQLVSNLTSDFLAQSVYSKVNDSQTIDDPFFYGGDFWIPDDHGTSHTSILAQNGDAVSVTSTINLAYENKY